MNIKYYIGLILVLVMSQMPAKAQTPDDLQESVPKSVAQCVVNGERLTCVIVEWKGITYSIAGHLKGEDFYARYIGRQSNGKWVIVWSYGKTI